MAVMALVQTLTDPNAQFTTQIPYEERNVANIRNGAVTYEGQGIARAGGTQKMDNDYITPRKLALRRSTELIHYSRARSGRRRGGKGGVRQERSWGEPCQ